MRLGSSDGSLGDEVVEGGTFSFAGLREVELREASGEVEGEGSRPSWWPAGDTVRAGLGFLEQKHEAQGTSYWKFDSQRAARLVENGRERIHHC